MPDCQCQPPCSNAQIDIDPKCRLFPSSGPSGIYAGGAKMAGSFASALLDELMGRNRDKQPEGQRKTHWSDPEVMCFGMLILICGYSTAAATMTSMLCLTSLLYASYGVCLKHDRTDDTGSVCVYI